MILNRMELFIVFVFYIFFYVENKLFYDFFYYFLYLRRGFLLYSDKKILGNDM